MAKVLRSLLRNPQLFIFQLLVFSLPTQLAFHFWPKSSFIFGIRVDYLSPAIYFTDLLILLFIVFSLFKNKTRIISKAHIFIVVYILINIIASKFAPITFYKWLKVILYILFVQTIQFQQKFTFKNWLYKPLSISLIFFGVIGIAQTLIGRSTGLFWLLGERSFNISTPGIALGSLLGNTFLRPYSVFSHPNSLAGYYLVTLIILLGVPRKTLLNKISLVIGSIVVLLAFSKAVWITAIFVLGIMLLVRQKVLKQLSLSLFPFVFSIISIPLTIIGDTYQIPKLLFRDSIVERMILFKSTGSLLASNFLFGTGLGNHIVSLSKLTPIVKNIWLLQPVHNIFLLIFTEVGIIGLIVFLVIMAKTLERCKNNQNFQFALIAILTTGFFDHYWLTLQQNILLLVILLSLSFKKT